MLCLPCAAARPWKKGGAPWQLLAACVDGMLRIASHGCAGHAVVFADDGAKEFLFCGAGALIGSIFEDLLPSEKRQGIRNFLMKLDDARANSATPFRTML